MQKYMINPTLMYATDKNNRTHMTIQGEGYIIAAADRKELIDAITEKSYTLLGTDDATRIGKTILVYTACVKVPNKMRLETISAKQSIELFNKNRETREIQTQYINPRPKCIIGSKEHVVVGDDRGRYCKVCGIVFHFEKNDSGNKIYTLRNCSKDWWNHKRLNKMAQRFGGKEEMMRALLKNHSFDHHTRPIEEEE